MLSFNENFTADANVDEINAKVIYQNEIINLHKQVSKLQQVILILVKFSDKF